MRKAKRITKQCEGCGKDYRVKEYRKNTAKYCGIDCQHKYNRRQTTKSLIGQEFGLLTVIKKADKPENFKNRGAWWWCQCSCGNSDLQRRSSNSLKQNKKLHCGCTGDDGRFKPEHGLSSHRLFPRFRNLISRCHNPEHSKYEYYGGRGIKVCDRWRAGGDVEKGFKSFLEDMEDSFEEGLTIERLDNMKGYSPDNCAWRTMSHQVNNRRPDNIERLITHGDKIMNMVEWSRYLGGSDGLVTARINQQGWSEEKAVSTPVKKRST